MFQQLSSTQLKDMVRAVRLCKTANEERTLVARECAILRNIFKEESTEQRCVAVTKLLYFYILGYPAHFGQMECLKLIASTRFVDKRIGYLGCMMLLDELADVHVLVTNCLKNDLNHSSQHVQGLALCTLASICSTEMARVLAIEVERLIRDSSAYLKKKAALCAARIINKAPEFVNIYAPYLKTLIRDSNVGVQLCGCTLAITMCEIDASVIVRIREFDLVPHLCKTLRTLVNYGSSVEHSVHGVGNPFLQVKILRLLSLIGKGDPEISETFSDLLAQVITNTEVNKTAGNAVLYEAALTIFNAACSKDLRVLAINLLGKFLQYPDKNMKYVAITTMLKVSHQSTASIMRHRNYILKCIKEEDPCIKRRAIELIFTIITPENIADTVEELLKAVPSCEPDLKQHITSNIITALEKHHHSKEWQISTFLDLLETASAHVRDDAVSRFVGIISSSPEVQREVTTKLYYLLLKNSQEPILTNVACWCIGEYGNMMFSNFNCVSTNIDPRDVILCLHNILDSNFSSKFTKYFAIYALSKLSIRVPSLKTEIANIIKRYSVFIDPELQQRALEFGAIISKPPSLGEGIFENMPPLLLERHEIKSSDVPVTTTTTVTENPKKEESLLDLLGTDIFSQQAPSQLLSNCIFGEINSSQPAHDLSQTTSNFILDTSPYFQTAPSKSSEIYNKNGLSITMVVNDSTSTTVTSLIICAKNSSNTLIDNFLLQAAVPKGLTVTLKSPSATKIHPNYGDEFTQNVTINNPNELPLRLRLRFSFLSGTTPVEDIVEVSNFPGLQS